MKNKSPGMSRPAALKVAPLIYALNNCGSQQEQRLLVSHLNDKGIGSLCKAIKLVMSGAHSAGLSPARQAQVKRALSSHGKALGALTRSGLSANKKRQILSQQKGGALSLILGAALPFVVDLIGKAIRGFKKK